MGPLAPDRVYQPDSAEVAMHALRALVARENVGLVVLALEAGLRPLEGASPLDRAAASLLERLDGEVL